MRNLEDIRLPSWKLAILLNRRSSRSPSPGGRGCRAIPRQGDPNRNASTSAVGLTPQKVKEQFAQALRPRIDGDQKSVGNSIGYRSGKNRRRPEVRMSGATVGSPATSASARIPSPTSSNGIGQIFSVGFRPLPDSTPVTPWERTLVEIAQLTSMAANSCVLDCHVRTRETGMPTRTARSSSPSKKKPKISPTSPVGSDSRAASPRETLTSTMALPSPNAWSSTSRAVECSRPNPSEDKSNNRRLPALLNRPAKDK